MRSDLRINRKGRLRSFDELRKLAQAIANETTTDTQGNKITTADALLRSWARKQTADSAKSVHRGSAFGKVPDKLETNPLDKKTTLILYYNHERPRRRRREAGGRLPAEIQCLLQR